MARLKWIKMAQTAAFGVALGVMGAFSFSGTADAATCGVGGVTIDGYGAADDCNGPIAGNDTGGGSTFLDDLGDGLIFPGYGNLDLLMDWQLFGKSDSDLNVDADEGAIVGSWEAFGVVANTLVVTLKAGDSFTAFLFETVTPGDISGTFNTLLAGLVNDQGGALNLSHLSIFAADGDVPPPPPPGVPLPAAGWMLLAGLGGLAVARRRRKA